MTLPSLCNPAPAPLAMVTHVVTHVVITPPTPRPPQAYMPWAKPIHPPLRYVCNQIGRETLLY